GTDHPFFTSLSVTWRLPHFDGLSLTAAVDNLWNVRYQEIPLVPGAPRTCSLRATYVW
ncbi:MAG: TonB-dependent receptor, partial [Puniceicoccales bacterium]|nr:TonB-dependent receptor [Puniceicoccales bacterium]